MPGELWSYALLAIPIAGSVAAIGWLTAFFGHGRKRRFNGAPWLLAAIIFVTTMLSGGAGVVIGGTFGGAYGAKLSEALGLGEKSTVIFGGAMLGIWIVMTAPSALVAWAATTGLYRADPARRG